MFKVERNIKVALSTRVDINLKDKVAKMAQKLEQDRQEKVTESSLFVELLGYALDKYDAEYVPNQVDPLIRHRTRKMIHRADPKKAAKSPEIERLEKEIGDLKKFVMDQLKKAHK